MAELLNYPVLSPVLYDRRYEIGETITLDEATAGPLKQAGAIGEATGAASAGGGKTTLNVAQTVELVKAAQADEELDKLAEGETRKGVLDAIAARKAELAQDSNAGPKG